MKRNCLVLAVAGLTFFISATSNAYAVVKADFSFKDFSGLYYLERDSKGVAKLAIQEDMIVDYPASSNLFGLRRSVPENYEGHSLDLKIIGVTDNAGSPIEYRTTSDGTGNRIIETGDKDITLSGIQTYRINYQTSGVASFLSNKDEFLINVNGRGWQEPFDSAKAFIHLSKSFSSQLSSDPICYIGYKKLVSRQCTIKTQTVSDGVQVNAATQTKLAANQSLIVKMNFKKGTFKQKATSHSLRYLEIGGAALTLIIGIAFTEAYLKSRKHP